jgi:uncharacterized protein YndB with AHSA1/START domain
MTGELAINRKQHDTDMLENFGGLYSSTIEQKPRLHRLANRPSCDILLAQHRIRRGCTIRLSGKGENAMAKIVKTITIDAPIEKVFSYVEEPANVPEYWPSVIEVKDVESLPGGGFKYRWVYKMAGVRFEGGTETTEFVVNERTVSENTGGVSGTITWTYQSEIGKTQVTFEAEYTVQIPLLRKLAESFVVKLNEQEAEVILANVKAKLEA